MRKSKFSEEQIVNLLKSAERPRFGYRRLGVMLEREGISLKHKRLHRLYREEGLVLRKRRRQRASTATRAPLVTPRREVFDGLYERQPCDGAQLQDSQHRR